MMDKKKYIYVPPEALIVELSLFTPLAQRPPGGGGGWEEFDPTSNGGTQLGRGESSFFGEEEEDGMINGGLNMFPEWDDKDKL